MRTFNWKEAQGEYCEAAYYYLLHVHVKNIQEEDFIRGYASLPHKHCFSNYSRDKDRIKKLYYQLKKDYGFFIKENFT